MIFNKTNDSMRRYTDFTDALQTTMENLTHLQLVKITGVDARDFLQGQLTNDLNTLNDEWQYSAYCSPKGRALAVFIVWKDGDTFYILLESSVKESVIKRLRMYVMRSKVVLEECGASLIGTLNNKRSQDSEEGVDRSKERFLVSRTVNSHTLHFGSRAIVVRLDTEPVTQISNTINQDWVTQDILDGLPRVTTESIELFIPQMLNLDLLNGISFKKGCYTGQEIIARMRYLGKLKQRSFVCSIAKQSVIKIGEKVIDGNEKTVGNITNCVSEGSHVVAALRFENLLSGLFTESGAELQICETQPYAIET